MTPLGIVLTGGLAALTAYVTRIIGPKVRVGDEVLVNAQILPPGGVPLALAMYPLFLIKVGAVSGDTFSGYATGGAAAMQADGSVVVSRFGTPVGPFSGIAVSSVVKAPTTFAN